MNRLEEQLKEVKRQFWEEGDLSIAGFEFLLSQAERVEELEEEKHQDPRQGMLEDLHMENEQLKKRVEELEEENKKLSRVVSVVTSREADLQETVNRYKQALEEILEARNKFYLQDYVDGVEEVAEKALEVNK